MLWYIASRHCELTGCGRSPDIRTSEQIRAARRDFLDAPKQARAGFIDAARRGAELNRVFAAQLDLVGRQLSRTPRGARANEHNTRCQDCRPIDHLDVPLWHCVTQGTWYDSHARSATGPALQKEEGPPGLGSPSSTCSKVYLSVDTASSRAVAEPTDR
jgi:hypothetical protein